MFGIEQGCLGSQTYDKLCRKLRTNHVGWTSSQAQICKTKIEKGTENIDYSSVLYFANLFVILHNTMSNVLNAAQHTTVHLV